MKPQAALLVLADGTTFEGEAIGATPAGGVTSGEVVFNTAMSGYQEIVTDPSYAGQIIAFTYPHIGNYGVVPVDAESRRPFCRGVIVRDLVARYSNWRAQYSLDAYLRTKDIAGIAGIDTRRLTRHLRDVGAMPGAYGAVEGQGATTEVALRAAAIGEPGTDGVDLVAEVSCEKRYTFGAGPRRVVAYDYGIKTTILLHLASFATIEVWPASTPAAVVLDREPDGVFLSNGPGDPAMVPYAVDNIRQLLDRVPVFGICLGHQLLSLAIGAATEKLPFGHHGANHPVRNIATGQVEITSQNHNFAVSADSLAGLATMTHVNLNDGVCEGMQVSGVPAFSVQYHPEAGPGPHDASYLFKQFDELMGRTNVRGLSA